MKTFAQHIAEAHSVSTVKDLAKMFPFVHVSRSDAWSGEMRILPKNIRELRDELEEMGYESDHYGDGMEFKKKGKPVIRLSFDASRSDASINIERHNIAR